MIRKALIERNDDAPPNFNANVADTTGSGNKTDDSDEDTPEQSNDGDGAEMQANVTSSEKGKVHPAALARMMASKNKKPSGTKSTGSHSVNNVAWQVHTHESVAASTANETPGPFLDELEKWSTNKAESSDPLKDMGNPKDTKDQQDDPFGLFTLMEEGEGPDFW